MTVAAVDRLVHHALIVELKADSYRKRSAANRLPASSPTLSDEVPPDSS